MSGKSKESSVSNIIIFILITVTCFGLTVFLTLLAGHIHNPFIDVENLNFFNLIFFFVIGCFISSAIVIISGLILLRPLFEKIFRKIKKMINAEVKE